jgi:predicted nucleic-acid-binding protein
MRIIADTNLLVRAAVRDDPAQAEKAALELSRPNSVAVPMAALCEFVWVLSRAFKRDRRRSPRRSET